MDLTETLHTAAEPMDCSAFLSAGRWRMNLDLSEGTLTDGMRVT